MFRFDFHIIPFGYCDMDVGFIFKTADALIGVDVVFVHQEFNPFGGLLHHRSFTGHHFLQIDFYLSRNLDAVLFKMLYCIFVMMGRI